MDIYNLEPPSDSIWALFIAPKRSKIPTINLVTIFTGLNLLLGACSDLDKDYDDDEDDNCDCNNDDHDDSNYDDDSILFFKNVL